MIRGLSVRLALLAACYLVATITQVNHIVYTLVKGHYLFYQSVFYLSLFFLSLAVVPIQHSSDRRVLWLSLSPVIGYCSGLVAFFLMPLLRRGSGLVNTFKMGDLSVSFFVSPLFTFAWLVGFYFVVLVILFQASGVRRVPVGGPMN